MMFTVAGRKFTEGCCIGQRQCQSRKSSFTHSVFWVDKTVKDQVQQHWSDDSQRTRQPHCAFANCKHICAALLCLQKLLDMLQDALVCTCLTTSQHCCLWSAALPGSDIVHLSISQACSSLQRCIYPECTLVMQAVSKCYQLCQHVHRILTASSSGAFP